MQVNSTTPGLGAQLFGGLFGQQAPAGNGLFGMLMALFGQQQGNSPMLATGQNLPGQGMSGLIDPATLLLTAGTAADGSITPTLPGAELLSWLQSLSGGQPLSPELQNLLGGAQLDIATLNARLDAMANDQRDAVMAELAALLQPLLPNLPTTPLNTGVGGDIAPVSTSPTPAPGQSVLPPPPAAAPEASSVADSAATLPPEKAQALATLGQVLQNQQDKAQSRGRDTDKTTSLANALSQIANNASETNEARRSESNGPPALANLKPVANSKLPAGGEDGSSTAGAAAISAPGPQTTHIASARNNENKAQTAQAVTPVSSESGSTNTAATGKESQANLTASLSEAPRPEMKFADHLEQVKLNRTGAHVPVTEQVAVHLTRAVQQGHERMTIRLHPAELGRIEVKLDVSADGIVKASFHVDQPATLDLLKLDAKGLERALGDAGLKADGSSLNFNLRGDSLPQRGQSDQQASQDGQGGRDTSEFNLDGSESEWTPAGIIETTWYLGPDRVDVRI